MSRNASVTLTWADGDYPFRLAIGQMRELQEKTDAGPLELFRRFEVGKWRVDDVLHTMRLGLIGGGMDPISALRLVRVYVEDRPPLENVLFAQAVLWAGIAGAPDEDKTAQKKSEAEADPSPSPETKSASPTSTASAVQ